METDNDPYDNLSGISSPRVFGTMSNSPDLSTTFLIFAAALTDGFRGTGQTGPG